MNSPQDEPALLTRLRNLLANLGVGQISERKLFGSQVFLVRGHLCVAARAGRVLCRIDPQDHDAALKRKGCSAVVMRGQVYRGYLNIAAHALKTRRSLASWTVRALTYNQTLEARKPGSQEASKTASGKNVTGSIV